MTLPQPPDVAEREAASLGQSHIAGAMISAYRTLWAYCQIEQKKVASLESEIRELRAAK